LSSNGREKKKGNRWGEKCHPKKKGGKRGDDRKRSIRIMGVQQTMKVVSRAE